MQMHEPLPLPYGRWGATLWATAYATHVLEDGVLDGSVHILPALIYDSPACGSAQCSRTHLAPPPRVPARKPPGCLAGVLFARWAKGALERR